MKVIDWFGNIFRKKQDAVTIQTDSFRADPENQIAIEAFSLFSVIEMIAALISKCEFKTYKNGKEFRGYNWYSLNVKPNKNQNSSQFWQEYVSKLLYFGEALIIDVNGQKIIADSFNKDEFAVKETVFSQVSRGDLVFNKKYKMSDVIYTKYTNMDAKAVINSIFSMYEKLIVSASDKYIKSGGQKGILNIPAITQNENGFEEKFKNLMNNYFQTYFKGKDGVLPLWGNMTFQQSNSNGQKTVSEITDIAKIVDESLSRAAQAYRVSPALVKGDVAGIKDAVDMTLTICIDPMVDMISEELTGKTYSPEEVISGNYVEADTSCIKHIDIFDVAVSADKLISSGSMSPNEVRKSMRLTEIDEDWANEHYITKNYQETVKGGENNESE